ncbi:hypothetical protein GQ457_04G013910 [Hibiscus cannabinus]
MTINKDGQTGVGGVVTSPENFKLRSGDYAERRKPFAFMPDMVFDEEMTIKINASGRGIGSSKWQRVLNEKGSMFHVLFIPIKERKRGKMIKVSTMAELLGECRVALARVRASLLAPRPTPNFHFRRLTSSSPRNHDSSFLGKGDSKRRRKGVLLVGLEPKTYGKGKTLR